MIKKKNKQWNKKGAFYLIISVLFIAIFATVFLILNEYKREDKTSLEHTRVRAVNDFIVNLEDDMQRVVYITGFRALLGLETHLTNQGEFFANQEIVEQAFTEAFVNATINNTPVGIMVNNSFTDYLDQVRLQADKIAILANITITNVNIMHHSPWILEVTINASFNISDQKQTSWWLFNQTITTDLPITDLRDPLYAVNTLGRVPNTIRNYSLPADGYVNDTDNSTTTLQEFVTEMYYAQSTTGPSFLQRFTNNLSASPHGIESFVNLPRLSDQGLTTHNDRSTIDHIYFSQSPDNSSDRCSITGMIFTPNWFRVDEEHAIDYEISEFNYTAC